VQPTAAAARLLKSCANQAVAGCRLAKPANPAIENTSSPSPIQPRGTSGKADAPSPAVKADPIGTSTRSARLVISVLLMGPRYRERAQNALTLTVHRSTPSPYERQQWVGFGRSSSGGKGRSAQSTKQWICFTIDISTIGMLIAWMNPVGLRHLLCRHGLLFVRPERNRAR